MYKHLRDIRIVCKRRMERSGKRKAEKTVKPAVYGFRLAQRLSSPALGSVLELRKVGLGVRTEPSGDEEGAVASSALCWTLLGPPLPKLEAGPRQ